MSAMSLGRGAAPRLSLWQWLVVAVERVCSQSGLLAWLGADACHSAAYSVQCTGSILLHGKLHWLGNAKACCLQPVRDGLLRAVQASVAAGPTSEKYCSRPRFVALPWAVRGIEAPSLSCRVLMLAGVSALQRVGWAMSR
jgi:hypothetical protein